MLTQLEAAVSIGRPLGRATRDDVSGRAVGEEVLGFSTLGSYAEHIVVPVDHFEHGDLAVSIRDPFPPGRAAEATESSEGGRGSGKIVLMVSY